MKTVAMILLLAGAVMGAIGARADNGLLGWAGLLVAGTGIALHFVAVPHRWRKSRSAVGDTEATTDR